MCQPPCLQKKKLWLFVRNERRIELAAEGHRFDDIRRYGNDYCSKAMNSLLMLQTDMS
ncbi:RagB/SusD family nutrient uptake outer membrane protein [Bacteroides fragilis]|nr:RagB/SusD family nutrient uptake outer membrane protein [Bacteroides fragilis]